MKAFSTQLSLLSSTFSHKILYALCLHVNLCPVSCIFLSTFSSTLLICLSSKRTLSLCHPLHQQPLITPSPRITSYILGLAFRALHQLTPFYPTTSLAAVSLVCFLGCDFPQTADQSPASGTPGRCQCYQQAPWPIGLKTHQYFRSPARMDLPPWSD